MKKLIWLLLCVSAFAQVKNGQGGMTAFSGSTGSSYQDAALISAPSSPAAGYNRIFMDTSTGNLTCKKSDGTSCLNATASAPFISSTANPANAGVVRMSNNVDKVCWRNNTNAANFCLYLTSGNVFNFENSVSVPALALQNVTGGTKCLQADASGNVTGASNACGQPTSGTSILKGDGLGGFSSAVANTDYVATTRTINNKALSANITLSLASSDFANQGTTTTVLHGNAAGAPAFGAVTASDAPTLAPLAGATFTGGVTVPGFTLSGITGSTQCLHVNASGIVSGTGSDCGAGGGGSGTVTVVGAGTVQSNAIVTGGGSQQIQTPSASATLDTSGNISTPGTITTGTAGSSAGAIQLSQGTTATPAANSIIIQAPAAVTAYTRTLAGAAASGIPHFTNSSGVVTETISAVALADHATQAADTVVMNASGSVAAPSAVSVNNCGDSTHALSYNTTTHAWGCQAITATASAGGSNTQLQYNNSGALQGISQWTTNGTTTLTGGSTAVFDASAAGHTLPSKTGLNASKPATCTVGEEYFASDATAGQNKYYCTATNTWTQQSGAGGGSGTVNSGTAGQVAYYASSTTAVSGNANLTMSSGALTVGAASAGGSITLKGNTSGQAGIAVAAAAGTPSTIVLPTADPTNGQVLTAGTPSGGSVTTSWTTISGGSGATLIANSGDAWIPGIGLPHTLGTYPNEDFAFISGGINNATILYKVFMPGSWTPDRMAIQITTAGDSGCKIEFGVYNMSKSLIIHSGVITATTTVECDTIGSKVISASTTPAATGLGTTYAAGWYWIAFTGVETTAGTMRVEGAQATGAGIGALWNSLGDQGAALSAAQSTTNGALNASFTTGSGYAGGSQNIYPVMIFGKN